MQINLTISAQNPGELQQVLQDLANLMNMCQQPVTTPTPVSTPVPAPAAVPTVASAPATPTVPAQTPAPAPATAAVPITTQTYTMDQLAVAATQLVDAGRREELVQLLASFGVQALTALPKEQYGAFATALRQMGAKI